MIKFYFINNQELILDRSVFIQISLVEIIPIETTQIKTSLVDISPIEPLIEPVAKSSLATLASLALIKQSYRQFWKYPKQANITAPLEIYVLIDEFDVFINKNTGMQLA